MGNPTHMAYSFEGRVKKIIGPPSRSKGHTSWWRSPITHQDPRTGPVGRHIGETLERSTDINLVACIKTAFWILNEIPKLPSLMKFPSLDLKKHKFKFNNKETIIYGLYLTRMVISTVICLHSFNPTSETETSIVCITYYELKYQLWNINLMKLKLWKFILMNKIMNYQPSGINLTGIS